ncbi:MAG TPA: DUF503 domain-containing protein [Ktedonobacterales bacterium]|jgi:uncharacterized protein YlxP (DUF503 family)|nr:DUF503 domain-containing protein [Ktedonobacterales bacterium]
MMYVATAQVTIRLFQSDSLKDKRQVTRSVLARLRDKFEISAAEVGGLESWNLAQLGIACVSGDASHAQEVIERAIHYIEETRPDIEISDISTEVITLE